MLSLLLSPWSALGETPATSTKPLPGTARERKDTSIEPPRTSQSASPNTTAESADPASTLVPQEPAQPAIPEATSPDTELPSGTDAERTYRNDTEQPDPDAPTASEPTPRPLKLDAALGVNWWLVQNKVIFGPTLRFGGRWIGFNGESNLLLVTRSNPTFDHTVLGAVFGTYLTLSPVRTRRVEWQLGLGADYHWLFAINAEEWKFAFSARTSVHGWLNANWGVFAAARSYLVASEGLGLGTSPQGIRQFPAMLSLGVEWRPSR